LARGIRDARAASVQAIATFAAGLQQDSEAVRAALATRQSRKRFRHRSPARCP
jgi:hypothetical protein